MSRKGPMLGRCSGSSSLSRSIGVFFLRQAEGECQLFQDGQLQCLSTSPRKGDQGGADRSAGQRIEHSGGTASLKKTKSRWPCRFLRAVFQSCKPVILCEPHLGVHPFSLHDG